MVTLLNWKAFNCLDVKGHYIFTPSIQPLGSNIDVLNGKLLLANTIIQSTFDVKFVLWKKREKKYDFVILVSTWIELSFNLVQFEYKTNHGSNIKLTFNMFILMYW